MRKIIIALTLLVSTSSFAASLNCTIMQGQLKGESINYHFNAGRAVTLTDSTGKTFDCSEVDLRYINLSDFSLYNIDRAVVCEAGFFSSVTVFNEKQFIGEIAILDKNSELECRN